VKYRLEVFPLVFIPWLILYEFVVYRGPAPSAFTTYLPLELGWPIWQPMEVFYVSAYLLVTLAPLAASTNRVLRRFAVGGLLSIVLGNLIFLAIPAIAPPRPFQPSGLLGRMMVLDRNLDLNNGTASFPSFHVVWSFLGGAVFAQRWPRIRFVCWAWAHWYPSVASSQVCIPWQTCWPDFFCSYQFIDTQVFATGSISGLCLSGELQRRKR
jgi:hypothetical protein